MITQGERIYRIPKNLNEEFSFITFYKIQDVFILVLLSAGAAFFAYTQHILWLFIFPTAFAVLRFRMCNYPAHFWAIAAISYLFGESTHYNEFILFEKEMKAIGNDEPPEL